MSFIDHKIIPIKILMMFLVESNKLLVKIQVKMLKLLFTVKPTWAAGKTFFTLFELNITFLFQLLPSP